MHVVHRKIHLLLFSDSSQSNACQNNYYLGDNFPESKLVASNVPFYQLNVGFDCLDMKVM
jgi:hypothetical protein